MYGLKRRGETETCQSDGEKKGREEGSQEGRTTIGMLSNIDMAELPDSVDKIINILICGNEDGQESRTRR